MTGEGAMPACVLRVLLASSMAAPSSRTHLTDLVWQVQQGIPVIPKTANPVHMRENIDLFDWNLDDDEMARLTAATTPAVAGAKGPGGEPVSGDCGVA